MALAKYGVVKVQTSSPGRLLVMIYDGLLRFLDEAAVAMRAGNLGRAGERIGRCHAILEELLVGLDPTFAPDLCATLGPLYTFCMQHLVEANVSKSGEKIAEVAKILAPLREAFTLAVAETERAPR